MEPVVGIFPDYAVAQRAVRLLGAAAFAADRVELLLPGNDLFSAPPPTEEAEQPRVGEAVGGVVGAATGATAGFGLGAVTASLLVPGIGAISAIGLAAAAILGVIGAVGGATAGEALEEQTRSGVPKDEVYLYEDALSRGKGVVFVTVADERESTQARGILAAAGAESLDAAREAWWVGIRDPEGASNAEPSRAAAAPDTAYRRGFLAAFDPEWKGKPYREVLAIVQRRVGSLAPSEAFQRGYTRGSAVSRAPVGDREAGLRT